jgi:hypothetical protein
MAHGLAESIRTEPELRTRRWLTRALVVAAGVSGVGIGVVLSIVTVIVPRRHELSRVRPTSRFLRDFDPWAAMKSIKPLSGTYQESDDRNPWDNNRIFARTYRIDCQVPAAEQTQLLQQLHGAIQSGIAVGGGPRMSVWSSKADSHNGPDGMTHESAVNYRDGAVLGVVRVWAFGRGDQMRLIISATEP